MFDYKKHFKMYKSGKLWVVAGIVSVSLLSGGIKAHADTETSSQAPMSSVGTASVSSEQTQTTEKGTVDSLSGSTNAEKASTTNELAAPAANKEQSSINNQTTADDQNNDVVSIDNVQNTIVAKDTQSAIANTSASNTTTAQTGTLPVNQVSGTTEVHQDGHWYLKDFQGNYLNGWQKLAGNRIVYYDPQNNQMQYGLQTVNDKIYYFNTWSGGMYASREAQINGKIYYFNTNTWSGEMYAGKEAQINGKWYNFTSDGSASTGFTKLASGKTVYYNAQGQMQYGLQTINGKSYYFNPWSGKMYAGKEAQINGKWYNFTSDGSTSTGFTKLASGKTVYYNAQGQMQYGLQTINGKIYYFNTWSGEMYAGKEAQINGKWYNFTSDGSASTGFTKMSNGRLVYYNADGQMQYGEQKIDGKWYHFQTDNGNTARGWYTLEDGRQVYYDVDKNGNGQGMLHGLGKVGNDYYYFNDATGAKETGLKTLNGQTYNFAGNNGQALLSQFWTNNNQTYYFNQQGQMVKNQQLTIAGEQWQFDADGVGTKVVATIADNWNFDKKANAELNNLGNIEGTTGEYNGLLIDASKAGAKFSPRDAGDAQVNANTVISVPIKANQYGAKITIELSGGTADLTISQESQIGLKGTFVLTVPAMAADGLFAITFNSTAYLKNLKVDYLTQAPEEYPGTPSNVKAEDTNWNLVAGSKQIVAAQNSRAEYGGLKIDASTAGAKFAPRDNNDGAGLDTQINSGTIIYVPIAVNQNGATLKLTGQKSAGLTIMVNNQEVTLGNEFKIDATSAPTYLKTQFASTGSAYLTDIAVCYNAAYPGTPTVLAKDTDWNLSNDNSRPTVQNNQGEYNGLKIDGTNGKFAPRSMDTQVNGGTIIYIPIAADAKSAKVTISRTANGQTLTLDDQAVTLGQTISVDSTSAHYLKLLVSGTGSAI